MENNQTLPTREEVIADFKQWLDEHREQWQAHILDALPMEDFDDDWEEENKMEKSVKVAIVGAFSALTAWLGVLAIPVYLLVACNIIDYFTGIMAALSRKEKISSDIGLRGIAKKIGQWLLVVIGWVVDMMIEYAGHAISPDFTIPVVVSICVASWLVFNEIISILENLKTVGVPLPGFLLKIVEFFRKKVEDIGDAATPNGEDGKNAESH